VEVALPAVPKEHHGGRPEAPGSSSSPTAVAERGGLGEAALLPPVVAMVERREEAEPAAVPPPMVAATVERCEEARPVVMPPPAPSVPLAATPRVRRVVVAQRRSSHYVVVVFPSRCCLPRVLVLSNPIKRVCTGQDDEERSSCDEGGASTSQPSLAAAGVTPSAPSALDGTPGGFVLDVEVDLPLLMLPRSGPLRQIRRSSFLYSRHRLPLPLMSPALRSQRWTRRLSFLRPRQWLPLLLRPLLASS
jgi:hypothetical protein